MSINVNCMSVDIDCMKSIQSHETGPVAAVCYTHACVCVCVCTRPVLLQPNLVTAGYEHIPASGDKSDSTRKTSSRARVGKAREREQGKFC